MLILYHFCVFRLLGGASLPTKPRAPGRQSWGLQTHLCLQHPDGEAALGGAEGVILPNLISGRKSAFLPRRQQSLKSGKVRMWPPVLSLIHSHARTRACMHTYINIFIHTHKHIQTPHIHTLVPIQKHTNTQTYTLIPTHTRTHARTHARTHTRTHAHTHTRTHAHTHTQTHKHTNTLYFSQNVVYLL